MPSMWQQEPTGQGQQKADPNNVTINVRKANVPNMIMLRVDIRYGRAVVGNIDAVYSEELKKFEIILSQVSQKYRGMGIGKEAYIKLYKFLKDNYKVGLASDIKRSEDAENLWRKSMSRDIGAKFDPSVNRYIADSKDPWGKLYEIFDRR